MDFENDDNLDFQLNKIASIVIKEKRLQQGYSLEELANRLNNIVTRQSLYRYESNEARMKNNIFKKICLALNQNPSDVWNEINNRFLNNLNFDNAIHITTEESIRIPVLGTIKAGIPMEAQQDIIDYVSIEKSLTRGGKEFFGLQISGDSMFPDYNEGEIVIFEKSNDYNIANNKDCAVMVNGNDATFKKVLINNNGIVLVPRNNRYNMMMYSNEEIEKLPVKIIGIAREKRTKV